MTAIRALSLTALTLLSGCGTYVPDLQDFWQSSETGHILVQDLVDYVACDVKRSVTQALLDDQRTAPYRIANGAQQGQKLDWLKSWAAQITFTLTVDEKSQLNPGVALNQIYPTAITTFANHPPVGTGQSFAMALAGAYSRQATRKETLSLYMSFEDFSDTKHLNEARQAEVNYQLPACNPDENGISKPDIKFMEWLYDAVIGTEIDHGVINYTDALENAAKAAKKDAISHEVTFVVIYGANATPTWKLVNFSGSTTSPLVGAQRTNTQDVIITLGPTQKGTLSVAAQNTTLASQIGLSVANAIRTTQ